MIGKTSLDRKFPAYKKASGWNALLPIRRPSKSTVQREFDTIIVGAGYTGLATARRLAELKPTSQILVLDATTVGEGSSGRNSGFMISLPHNIQISNKSKANQIALKQIKIYENGLSWLKNIVDEQKINCGWNEAGKFHAAASEAGIENLRATLKQYEQWGVSYTEYDRVGLEEQLGSSYYKFGFHNNNNVFIQPAALIRGLANTLPDNITLVEQETVLEIQHRNNPYVITNNGKYFAKQIVAANNNSAKLLGILRDRIITIYTYAALTPVLPSEELEKLGQSNEWGVIPADRLGTTLRKTQEGRFMVRSAYSYESELATHKVYQFLSESFKKRFPNMKSHEFEHTWGGTTALTRNSANFFGKVGTNLYASLGCNGAGVLKGTTYGKLLAELICGAESEDLSNALSMQGPSWLPPEPIRKIAVSSAIKYHAARAKEER